MKCLYVTRALTLLCEYADQGLCGPSGAVAKGVASSCNFFSLPPLHFAGESASVVLEHRKDATPTSLHEAGHDNLVRPNEREFYDNLLVSTTVPRAILSAW